MIRTILLVIVLTGCTSGFAQPFQLQLPPELLHRYIAAGNKKGASQPAWMKPVNSTVSFNWPQEITIGNTRNDWQSGPSAPQSRLAVYADGTLGTAWNLMRDTLGFSDKGTGYSYFDGNTWSGIPVNRIESTATQHPSLVPLGAGEAVVAEKIPAGPLTFCSRIQKGNGTWQETNLPLPPGVPGLVNPVMVSGGLGNTSVFILASTLPIGSGGNLYHGQDGAPVLLRTVNGGANWTIRADFPGLLDSSLYNGFQPGTMAMGLPRGNQLAFVIADPWSDLVLMKSPDNGTTWEKTVIWQHPVSHWNGEATDSIYCPDGSVHLAFDETGLIHIVFGLTRLFSDGGQVYRFPFVGGIAHWKEGQPVWTSGDLYNALNPDSLEVQGQLACSYLLDWNGNGTLDFLWNFPDYGGGPISQPQIAFDEYGVGMLLMSSVTEAYNDDVQDYRHIWYKYLYLGEVGNIAFDWNQQPVHLYHEGVFPSLGSRSPDNLGWPFLYQLDGTPGMAMAGDYDPFEENSINRVDLYYMLPVPLVEVNLLADPPGGGDVAGSGMFYYGSDVTISAQAYPGLEFVNWTSENVVFSSYPEVTFQALWNYNLTAHFRLLPGKPEDPAPEFSLSPNPASGRVTVKIDQEGVVAPMRGCVLDLTGNCLLPFDLGAENNGMLDISSLPSGVYAVRLSGADGLTGVRKLVVER